MDSALVRNGRCIARADRQIELKADSLGQAIHAMIADEQQDLVRVNRRFRSGEWQSVHYRPRARELLVLIKSEEGMSRTELQGQEVAESEFAKWTEMLMELTRARCSEESASSTQ
jgi:hypothetical protein